MLLVDNLRNKLEANHGKQSSQEATEKFAVFTYLYA